MKKLLIFIKKEFLEVLPPTIYFLVVFHFVAFMRSLLVAQYGITLTSSTSAIVGALIVGKSILIADALPISNLFYRQRHIYNLVWRIFIYLLIVLLFQILEELIPLISKYGSISKAGWHLVEEIHWVRFWATSIVLSVFLSVYCVTTTLIDAIGRREFLDIFFSLKKK